MYKDIFYKTYISDFYCSRNWWNEAIL